MKILLNQIDTKILYVLLFMCFTQIVMAQNGTPSIAGARGAAMGNLGVAFMDIHSAYSNQAGLAHLTNPAVNVTAERRFALSEISTYAAAFAYPTKNGTFSLALSYYGFEDFNEQKVGLGYSRKLFEKLSIGAQIDYFNTRIPEHGNASTFTFELGLLSELIENVFVGVHIFSPTRVEIANEDDIPSILKLGVSYVPSEKVTFIAEVEKDLEFEPSVKAGFEYTFVESFFLRAGIHTNPTLFSFGVGYGKGEGVNFDIAASFHQTLGWSPSLGVTYGLAKPKTKRRR